MQPAKINNCFQEQPRTTLYMCRRQLKDRSSRGNEIATALELQQNRNMKAENEDDNILTVSVHNHPQTR